MSVIDGFRHSLIGIVTCPSDEEIVPFNPSHRDIPLYRLEEDADAEPDFVGKKGDVLLGGGGGESAALRVSIPEAFERYTHHANLPVASVRKGYWTCDDAYVFGNGYVKLGWKPGRGTRLEDWLAGHIVVFLSRAYPEYRALLGPHEVGLDGGICRVVSGSDKQSWRG